MADLIQSVWCWFVESVNETAAVIGPGPTVVLIALLAAASVWVIAGVVYGIHGIYDYAQYRKLRRWLDG